MNILKMNILKTNKFIVFVLMFLVLIASATALNMTSGGQRMLYNIEKCEGPVMIEMTPVDKDIDIVSCNITNNDLYECQCQGSKDIILDLDNETEGVYDFRIQYYTDFINYPDNDNRTPTREEILAEDYKTIKSVNNVNITIPEDQKPAIDISVELKNVILFVILAVIILIGIILRRVRKKFGGGESSSDNDIFNYSIGDNNFK